MKVSWNWLRELVKLDGVSANTAAERLAAAGVAVDAVTPVAPGLRGVIVAEVRGKRPHPKADKLTLVDVFDGESVTQVVCGAPNVPSPGEPGSSPRVVWARPGACLPGGIELGIREVRGIPSPGMLCAEDELGLSTDHGGILVLSPGDELPIGSDFALGVGLPDTILELDITANRPDLLGHVGVARELAALFTHEGARLTLPTPDLMPYYEERRIDELIQVAVEDAVGCPRYLAQVATGLTVRPSPLRLRLLLQRLGSRPINNLVDATNLALFCFGQPLHAFDLQRLAGQQIRVRRAQPSESLKTLDGVERALRSDDLVIADAERALAIAGVMGGEASEVTAASRDILLESAYFSPATVRRTARRLKLHTEASHRFERGVDPNQGLEQASRYCLELLLRLGGGKLVRGDIDVYEQPLKPTVVALRPSRCSQLLGMDIPAPEQTARLSSLGLNVGASSDGVLLVSVPSFRPDLSREIDLIEEVARLIGYAAVPTRIPPLRLAAPPLRTAESLRRENCERARDLCAALGLDEIQLFSMTGPEKLRQVQVGSHHAHRPPLLLENPLREELSALRTQLLPGLLEALRSNLNHGLTDVRLFEVGEVFHPTHQAGQPDERSRVVGVLVGHRPLLLRPQPGDGLEFADVRGVVEELLAGLGYQLHISTSTPSTIEGAVTIRAVAGAEAPWLHPGVGAVIIDSRQAVIGDFGELHPDLRQRLGIEPRAFCFELDIPLRSRPQLGHRYQAPSRFPAIARDLSFFIDRQTPAQEVSAALLGANEPLLIASQVLEDYREAGKVPDGKKGLLLSLTYRSDERTLTDVEVEKAHERVLRHFTESLPVKLR